MEPDRVLDVEPSFRDYLHAALVLAGVLSARTSPHPRCTGKRSPHATPNLVSIYAGPPEDLSRSTYLIGDLHGGHSTFPRRCT